ncbi:hypothetical protein N7539_002992 [Penicillium diatomitis]|uniref:Uncharacterized protein n=1 Tax=Penicillium diatomitis TaxID=2819901 RepID=A0A9X0BZ55_9EURO|nr:uncharacterized protein N7539_002992 [Penicillium diatomitis]KAJ5491425.1 hypothetical protein N7539_002992 [Penicillium diatomitis]
MTFTCERVQPTAPQLYIAVPQLISHVDWPHWSNYNRRLVKVCGVWEYCNPEMTKSEYNGQLVELPFIRIPPEISDFRKDLTSISDLEDSDIDRLTDAIHQYKQGKIANGHRSTALDTIRGIIVVSVVRPTHDENKSIEEDTERARHVLVRTQDPGNEEIVGTQSVNSSRWCTYEEEAIAAKSLRSSRWRADSRNNTQGWSSEEGVVTRTVPICSSRWCAFEKEVIGAETADLDATESETVCSSV